MACPSGNDGTTIIDQARILDLLIDIQRETQVTYLLIPHDLDVVRHLRAEVAVMLKGAVAEEGWRLGHHGARPHVAGTLRKRPREP
ncbi:hypothetical protein [Streptomyces malaysiensis]|uniref:Uncharacterized protein n=1 Tax=Streptomyces malaysiensis subsp. samsunensis TaxID=459658 RepID=A0A9X2RV89_STRMQ|nr:hypothetical protein [Streptomyces samsunensis]MCQ8832032.1 hypothetical protein [Streptomyces samsunensis]